jgi:membrane protease subunit HflC
MDRRWLWLLGVLAFVVAVWNLALFTVPQWEQVMVVQLGEPVRVACEPGLYWKIPFIQQVT